MSLAALQPSTEPKRLSEPNGPERRLRALSAPRRRRPRLAYALLAVGGAIAIAAAQMVLSVATTQDSFELADLTAQQRALELDKQALNEEIVALGSPQALAKKAAGEGLVVAGSAAYLRLSDGKVLGSGKGSDWVSTVNPNGKGKVANSLLGSATTKKDAEKKNDAKQAAEDSAPKLPSLDEGLPSPNTH